MLNAYPDWKIPGEVIAIIPTADRSKATVKVRIAIKAKDARIVPDMGVRVALPRPASPRPARRRPPPGVLVPADAVRAEGDAGGGVRVRRDGKVERRSVTLGPDVGGQRQVLSGLRDGERVVLSPPPSLADGHAVQAGREQVSTRGRLSSRSAASPRPTGAAASASRCCTASTSTSRAATSWP